MSAGIAGWLAVGGIGGWLVAKIGDTLFESFISGIGKLEFIPTWCAFTCNAEILERGVIRSRYDPRFILKDELAHSVIIEGEFVNHRKSAVLMSKPVLWFMHASRKPFSYSTPELTVDGKPGIVIAIPGESSLKIQLKIDVPRDSLANYEGVLPVLELSTASKRKKTFRLSAGSFYGPVFAAWPRRGEKPLEIGRDRSTDEPQPPSPAPNKTLEQLSKD